MAPLIDIEKDIPIPGVGKIQCFWKGGDLGSIKSGMLIEVVNFSNPGWKLSSKDYATAVPEGENIRYYVTEHDESEEEFFREGLKEYGEQFIFDEELQPHLDREHLSYRHSSLMIDEEKLVLLTGDQDINTKVLQKGLYVPTIDCTGRQDIFKLTKDVTDFPKRLDSNLVTSGTYSIGPTGKDYLNWATFIADVGTLTGTLVGELQADIVNSSKPVLNQNYGTHTLRLTSDTPATSIGTGWTTTVTNSDQGFVVNYTGTTAWTVEFCDFHMIRSTAGSSSLMSLLDLRPPANATINVDNMFLDGNNVQGVGIYAFSGAGSVNIFGVASRNCNDIGIRLGVANTLIENSFCEGNGTGIFANNLAITVRNTVCGDNSTDFSNHGSAIGIRCVSSDGSALTFGTATNCTGSKTMTDDWYMDSSLATYLTIKSGATTAKTSDSSPTISTTLINLVEWSNEIGVMGVTVSVGGIIPILTHIYRQRRMN